MNKKFIGLKWKIGGLYAALMIFVIALIIAVGYQFTQTLLRDRLQRHQLAIATSFSDSVAGHLAGKNLLAIHVLASKYTFLEGTAYAFVRDNDGKIIAHSFASIPEEVHRGLPASSLSQVQRRELTFSGRPVDEIAVPILGGQLGAVHLGFGAQDIQAEVRRSFLPTLTVFGLILLAAVAASFALAHWMLRPIERLSTIAEQITRGDLENVDLSDGMRSRDEIGALAASLERMRSSLKAALSRLAREVS
jgi:histidine kinase